MRNQLLEKVLRWLRLHKVIRHVPKGSTLCDVGCGLHYSFLKSVEEKIHSGTGLDQDVTDAQHGRVELRKANLEELLPVPDGSFDVVSMLAVLEHIENDGEALEECMRILKPGGHILITVPTHTNKPVGEFLAYRLKLLEAEGYRDHKRYYNKKELREDLKKTGFVKPHLEYWELGMNLFARAQKPLS